MEGDKQSVLLVGGRIGLLIVLIQIVLVAGGGHHLLEIKQFCVLLGRGSILRCCCGGGGGDIRISSKSSRGLCIGSFSTSLSISAPLSLGEILAIEAFVQVMQPLLLLEDAVRSHRLHLEERAESQHVRREVIRQGDWVLVRQEASLAVVGAVVLENDIQLPQHLLEVLLKLCHVWTSLEPLASLPIALLSLFTGEAILFLLIPKRIQ
jgi:hypothetical protein